MLFDLLLAVSFFEEVGLRRGTSSHLFEPGARRRLNSHSLNQAARVLLLIFTLRLLKASPDVTQKKHSTPDHNS
jgi:hypothetical protein